MKTSAFSARLRAWPLAKMSALAGLALLFVCSLSAIATQLPPQTRRALIAHLPARLAPRAGLTFTVTSLADSDDASAGDGVCQTSSGNGAVCTLRAAIQEANANAGADTIVFNIPGAVQTITLSTVLPTITQPVVIDGANSVTTRVQIRGSSYLANGLDVTGGNSDIKNLVIGHFLTAIRLEINGGNSVSGCYIGLNTAGTAADANYQGIVIDNVPNNTIGLTTAGGGNVISGNNASNASKANVDILGANATGNVVQNNFIGTNAAGTAAITPVADYGVRVYGGDNNTIGGTTAATRNIISGNAYGVELQAANANDVPSGNKIQGNYIGTDVSGTAKIPNPSAGVLLDDAPSNFVGGITNTPGTGAGNVISGNGNVGIRVNASIPLGGTTPPTGGSNSIQGNLIGLDKTGTTALGNQDGIFIFNARATLIGGAADGARNVISGNGLPAMFGYGIYLSNADGTIIKGNSIGTDITGLLGRGNGSLGILLVAANTQIGGRTASERNVIAANGAGGINLTSTGNVIEGNTIGLAADGATVLGNSFYGVQITGTGNTLGGTATGAGNVISGNGGDGVQVSGGSHTIQGNLIGTDSTGTLDKGNTNDGIAITDAENIQVGGTATGARNVIAGNDRYGISFSLTGSGTFSGTAIEGNTIGLQADGTSALGNGSDGVHVDALYGTSAFNTLGGTSSAQANRIAFNGRVGVAVVNNTISNWHLGIVGNSIYSNTGLGIDLSTTANPDGVTPNDLDDPDNGPNGLQNFPVITGVAGNMISATLNSVGSNVYRVEFFVNDVADPAGNGEGQTFLGAVNAATVSSTNTGTFTFTSPIPIAGKFISATATRLDAQNAPLETSEFSQTFQAPAAQPSLSINNAAPVAEGDSGQANSSIFTVTLAAASQQEVRVSHQTQSGTATENTNFVRTAAQLIFAPNETTKTISVPIIGDLIAEGDETFTVVLSAPINATLNAQATTGTGTITDDDVAKLTLSIAPSTFSEAAGANAATGTVTRNTPITAALTVNLSSSNTNKATVPATVVIPIGQTAAQFPVSAIDNTIIDGDVTVTITARSGLDAANRTVVPRASAGLIATANVIVTDNDTVTPPANQAPVAQNQSVTTSQNTPKTLALMATDANNDALTFSIVMQPANGTLSGTAANLTYTPRTDFVGSDSFTFKANDGKADSNIAIVTVQVLAVVIPKPGTLQFSAPTYSVNESGPVATITITRNGGSDGAISVQFATSNGSATAGQDYTATTQTVTFAAGDVANKTVTIPITNDTLVEGNETVNLALSNPTGGATLGAQSRALLTIVDNDVPPSSLPLLSLGDARIREGNSGTKLLAFPVSLTRNGFGGAIMVRYKTINGSATSGSDYVAVTAGTLIIAASQNSGVINITINGDTIVEANETFSVMIALPSPANTKLVRAMATGTILNDDAAPTKINTATTVTSSLNPSQLGQRVTFTVRVRTASGSTIPAGTITLKDGATTLGSGALNAQGMAALTTSRLSIGTHPHHGEFTAGDTRISTAARSAVR